MPLNVIEIAFTNCDPASSRDAGRRDPGILLRSDGTRAVAVRFYDLSGKIRKFVSTHEKRENRYKKLCAKIEDAQGLKRAFYRFLLVRAAKKRILSKEQRKYPHLCLRIASDEDEDIRCMQNDGQFCGSIELRKDIVLAVSDTAKTIEMKVYQYGRLSEQLGKPLHEMHL